MKVMKNIIVTAVLTVWLSAGISAAAETDASPDTTVIQLDTIVVTGTKQQDDKQEIESRALRSHKVVDLAEILSDELVEVQMIRKGAYGNEVSMRGFGQENMKITIEGGLLEGACGSRKDPPLSHVNMLMVQKLDIQQGPFDVTQPGCLGGSVNIITKKPKSDFGAEFLGKAGSYGFLSDGVILTDGNETVQGLFGYNFSKSDPYEDGDGAKLWTVREGLPAPYNAEDRTAEAFRKQDVWGKLQVTPNDHHTLLLEHTYGQAEDILTPRVLFDTQEEKTNLGKASWEMRHLGALSKKLTLSFYRNEVDHFPYQQLRAVSAPKNNKVESVITGGGIQHVTELEATDITCGIDFFHRDWWGDVYNSLTGSKVNDYLIPSVQSLNTGGYILVERNIDKWRLGTGLRYDRFQQKADEDLIFSKTAVYGNRQVDHLLGGHLSAKYFFSDDILIFGGLGRGFRTPSSAERYIQGSPTFFGNPTLDPTTNTETDIGFRLERGRWMIQTKGFYSDLNDFIYQENHLAGYQSYTNIDAHLWGGDIKAEVDLDGHFSLGGAIACQRGRKDSQPDQNSDQDLGQIAPLKSRLSLNYHKENPFSRGDSEFFATIEWVHSDTADEIDRDAGEVRLSSWDVFNLRIGYQWKYCTLHMGIDNLFDRQYTVANSYEWDVIGGSGSNPAIVNEPGRFLYAGLRMNW